LEEIKFCNYGCGKIAKFQMTSGKWCCSKHYLSCGILREKQKNSVIGKSNKNGIVYIGNEKCSFGCNQIALYQFKNKKFCCSKNPSSCRGVRKRFSNSKIGNIPWNKGKKNCFSEITINNISERLKKLWENPGSWFNSNLCKDKCKMVMKKLWEKYGDEWANNIRNKNNEKVKNGTHIFQSEYFKNVVIPKRSENKRKWMLNGGSSYLNSFNKKISPSKPQLYIFDIVQENYPSAKIDFPCLNFYVDVAIPEYKIAIEYDGGWWHKNKEYDRWRQNKIESEGWLFIRYEGTIEKDFYPPKSQVLDDISNKIKEIIK